MPHNEMSNKQLIDALCAANKRLTKAHVKALLKHAPKGHGGKRDIIEIAAWLLEQKAPNG